MKHIIIGGGAIDIEFTKNWISEFKREKYIIACDKGYEACERLGIVPNIVIGDFDSASDGALERVEAAGIPVKRLNPVKDDTDIEAALLYAFQQTDEEDSIFILGGTGGRLDHTIGNLALLGMGAKNNRPVILMDSHNFVQMIKPGDLYLVDKAPGHFVSVFPYMGPCHGVNMTGFKYPLKDATLEGFNTLTVSNEVTADEGKIWLEDGYLIVMETRD